MTIAEFRNLCKMLKGSEEDIDLAETLINGYQDNSPALYDFLNKTRFFIDNSKGDKCTVKHYYMYCNQPEIKPLFNVAFKEIILPYVSKSLFNIELSENLDVMYE